MKFSSRFHVQSSRLGLEISIRLLALFGIGAGFWLAGFSANAQDLRAKAEAEGKLMMYATFTAAKAGSDLSQQTPSSPNQLFSAGKTR
jgi:hypothetical protein